MNKVVTIHFTDTLLTAEEQTILESRGKSHGFDLRDKTKEEFEKYMRHLEVVMKECFEGKI